MALIRKAKPKTKSGGYIRVFGNIEVGNLMSRVQSAVISSGSELEKLIRERAKKIDDIDAFLKQDSMPKGVFIVHKSQIKKCKSLDFSGAEPDFIVFERKGKQQHCYIIELKDGDTFDTKKASGERESMLRFVSQNAQRIPYRISVHFCCFNQDDPLEIVRGFKNKIEKEEAMTGRQFCELLELDYDAIVKERASSVGDNLPYFLSELVKISAVKEWLKKYFS